MVLEACLRNDWLYVVKRTYLKLTSSPDWRSVCILFNCLIVLFKILFTFVFIIFLPLLTFLLVLYYRMIILLVELILNRKTTNFAQSLFGIKGIREKLQGKNFFLLFLYMISIICYHFNIFLSWAIRALQKEKKNW